MEKNKMKTKLLPEQLLKMKQAIKLLQECGQAKKKVYVPAIPQQMSRNLIIARYRKLAKRIKRTPAVEILYEETGISRRNLYRITKGR